MKPKCFFSPAINEVSSQTQPLLHFKIFWKDLETGQIESFLIAFFQFPHLILTPFKWSKINVIFIRTSLSFKSDFHLYLSVQIIKFLWCTHSVKRFCVVWKAKKKTFHLDLVFFHNLSCFQIKPYFLFSVVR